MDYDREVSDAETVAAFLWGLAAVIGAIAATAVVPGAIQALALPDYVTLAHLLGK
jgi:hypothetical protein